jgi:hypothetical protein
VPGADISFRPPTVKRTGLLYIPTFTMCGEKHARPGVEQAGEMSATRRSQANACDRKERKADIEAAPIRYDAAVFGVDDQRPRSVG